MTERRVAVVGVHQTHHRAARSDVTSAELVYEAVSGLLRKLDISRDMIDTVVESSSDYWDGAGCSNIPTVDAAGANLKEESKVEDDGLVALIYAYMRILSGRFETALVVSHSKCSEVASPATLTNLSCDPIYQRMIGIDEVSAAAMQARLLLKRDVRENQIAQVSVKNLRNALKNEYANRKMNISIEDVLDSEVVAYPLKSLNCSVGCDGASAVVLASDKVAPRLTDKPVWIAGVGCAADEYYLGDRDPLEAEALEVASKKAYRAAGVRNASEEIHVAEVCEPFSHQEILWCEKLGFCEEGKGGKLVDDGFTEIDGALPVNPSGGVLSTDPHMVRGLLRVVEASLQLRGEAGAHQIKDCRTAVAHATSGLGGQFHGVIVLRSGE